MDYSPICTNSAELIFFFSFHLVVKRHFIFLRSVVSYRSHKLTKEQHKALCFSMQEQNKERMETDYFISVIYNQGTSASTSVLEACCRSWLLCPFNHGGGGRGGILMANNRVVLAHVMQTIPWIIFYENKI